MDLTQTLKDMVRNQPDSLVYHDIVIDYIPYDTTSYTEYMSASQQPAPIEYRFVVSRLLDSDTGETQIINSFEQDDIKDVVHCINKSIAETLTREINITIQTGYHNAKLSFSFWVPENATSEDIDAAAWETIRENLEWTWDDANN